MDDNLEGRLWRDIRLVLKSLEFTRSKILLYVACLLATLGAAFLGLATYESMSSLPVLAKRQDPKSLWVELVVVEFVAMIAILACITLKARLIRMDNRLASQHAGYYRARLEGEFSVKELKLLEEQARWERERDEWKAKTQSELYEIILDQVERGVLGPRLNPRDGGSYDFPDRS